MYSKYREERDVPKKPTGKEKAMRTEAERQDTRKAMAYDLGNILDERNDLDQNTVEEVKKIIKTYINTEEG